MTLQCRDFDLSYDTSISRCQSHLYKSQSSRRKSVEEELSYILNQETLGLSQEPSFFILHESCRESSQGFRNTKVGLRERGPISLHAVGSWIQQLWYQSKCDSGKSKQLVSVLNLVLLILLGLLVHFTRFDYKVCSSIYDVIENNFNTLGMFVRIYGPSIAPSMLMTCNSDVEKKYDNLLKALDPQLSCNYERRCAEATKEGGKVSGHTLGTWNIPPLILDEESYRSNASSSKLCKYQNFQVMCLVLQERIMIFTLRPF
ncbi:hypothetical protein K2173_026819 [Erythroxylum novogranatense]|uniref:Uncharacterized protein n=1 Tax=Erythroxylum novogranatense TaxID=1862640 RepID=A0AAV8TXA2_9ROSI|nr:hypothetical protein K2173_026819 [Erythroxylum novogranatense]